MNEHYGKLSPIGIDPHRGVPILPAYRYDCTLLRVWCAHEKTWHTHGVGNRRDFGAGDGHRVAHCSCYGSPLWDKGYVLREVGDWTTSIKNSVRPTRARQCPTCR